MPCKFPNGATVWRLRLPAAVVDALDLKEGDQIEIRIAQDRVFETGQGSQQQRALARLRQLRRPPAAWVRL